MSQREERAVNAILRPLKDFARQCHVASLKLVQEMDPAIWPECRVARGTCAGVGGQHSWVVLGKDVYAPDARIVDPTLWSYDPAVAGVWYGSAKDGRHVPHGGYGTIWEWGQPAPQSDAFVELTPAQPLSHSARSFIRLLGPLDRWGWGTLCDAPVAGWPAAEIIAAIADTKELAALVPIDRLGMLTDRNPGGLYLP